MKITSGVPRALRALGAGALTCLLVIGVASPAAATHVAPEAIAGGTNPKCPDLEGSGQSWIELKVDPNTDGQYSDGTLTVVIEDTTNDKTFSWSSNIGVDAVFVKAGSAGSNLYRYDDPAVTSDPGEETADTGLGSPGEGTSNGISHIVFCYDTGSTPSNTPSVSISPTRSLSSTSTPVTSVLPTRFRKAGDTRTLAASGPEGLGVVFALGLLFAGLGFGLAALGNPRARRT